NQAKAENTPVARENLHLVEGGAVRAVKVEVIPFRVPPAGVRFFLVLFQDGAVIPGPALPAPPPRNRPPPRPSTRSSSSSRSWPPCASTSSPSSRSTRAPTRS